MERYIRLDVKGTWKGNKHQSRSIAWYNDEDDRYLEDGVSCYKLNIDGFKDLMNYSVNNMSIKKNEDIERMQVTVFEGNWSGKGSDCEELAWCTKTVSETDFKKVSDKYDALYELYDNEEITEDEFNKGIEKIIAELQ